MNISHIRNCYGCGVCAISCPKKIIEISLNSYGFYEPHIVEERTCIDCGLCMDVCSFSNDGLSSDFSIIKSYAAWSNDFKIRRKCSSGGISFELGRYLIDKKYKVCGVKYNVETGRAEHYVAATIEELIPSVGSKYIQSYTVDGFKEINRKEMYLVTGTPCQIDSFRRYIRKFKIENHFILLDFFCHGVPSMFVWQKYVEEMEKQIGKITYASWRNKYSGWHDSWVMGIDGEHYREKNGNCDNNELLMEEKDSFIKSKATNGDAFYRLFLGDCCLGKACYEKCKFKYNNSSADIRIGDLWGKTYQNNEDGVSAVITLTEKGDEVLHKINCTLKEHPFDIVADGQMKVMPPYKTGYKKIMQVLQSDNQSLSDAIICLNHLQRIVRWKNKLKHPIRTILNIIKKYI